jgi:N-terminal domain on NACHT_NTPase and P-loop NTPases
MAGAELIGVSAAAVQFVDTGWRAFLALSQLCSDLRHAPRRVQTASRHLEATVEVVRSIQTLMNSVPPAQNQAITSLIEQALDQANQLEGIIASVSPTVDEGRLKRGWKAFVTAKKEEDILKRCRTLEGLKTTLDLRLGEMGIVIGRQQL